MVNRTSPGPGAGGPEWILWAGTVGFTSDLGERFAAAAATGCRRVSVSPPELARAAEAGIAPESVGRQARALGLDLVVDPVMNWYPDSAPSPSRFAGVSAADALELAERVGAVSLTAIGTATSEVPVGELGEHFARICDHAAGFGARVHLEFIPFTIITTLAIGWDVVRGADRDNGGLLFDTWHFYRGEPQFDVLAGIPGDRIFCVQLDDALATPQGELRAETSRRLLPGAGELDLAACLRALDDIGGLQWIGPEVLSPELEALPVAEAAELAMQRSRAVVAAALATAVDQ
jgi:sugar phosphate isomerase/epimerase